MSEGIPLESRNPLSPAEKPGSFFGDDAGQIGNVFLVNKSRHVLLQLTVSAGFNMCCITEVRHAVD